MYIYTHRIHVWYIWCAMDPINIPPMLHNVTIYTSTWILWVTRRFQGKSRHGKHRFSTPPQIVRQVPESLLIFWNGPAQKHNSVPCSTSP